MTLKIVRQLNLGFSSANNGVWLSVLVTRHSTLQAIQLEISTIYYSQENEPLGTNPCHSRWCRVSSESRKMQTVLSYMPKGIDGTCCSTHGLAKTGSDNLSTLDARSRRQRETTHIGKCSASRGNTASNGREERLRFTAH
jgi:hypothetical protein